MLIQALCGYYDILAKAGKFAPKGYSPVVINYCVFLTPDGKIDGILDLRNNHQIHNLPERTEKSAIDANIIEHRPKYLFGLNYDGGKLTTEDSTNNARASHKAFVEKNLDFLTDIHSPVIDAFRNFLSTWNPDAETDNRHLLGLGNGYKSNGYAFCLSGNPDLLLHEDPEVKGKWDACYCEREAAEEKISSQCAISGSYGPIAKLHRKIKGIKGGTMSEIPLIQNNEPSSTSYCNTQSYNSNVSVTSMRKYTSALNYLIASGSNTVVIGDTTVIFWAMKVDKTYESILNKMLGGKTHAEPESAEKTQSEKKEGEILEILKDAKNAKILKERLRSVSEIDPDVDFYIVGLKPYDARLAVKFVYRKKLGDFLWNLADFQQSLRMHDKSKPVSLAHIYSALLPPASSKDRDKQEDDKDEGKQKSGSGNKAIAALTAKLMESIINGTKFPVQLLFTVLSRVKADCHNSNIQEKPANLKRKKKQTPPNQKKRTEHIKEIHVSLIKAYLKRNHEEECKMDLDINDRNQGYLCGRLFAVLEQLQRRAHQQENPGKELNRTISDLYFASASSRPAYCFVKLMNLAQHHLAKLEKSDFFDKLLREIICKFNGEFPGMLTLPDQGRFIVGYYQQRQEFFKKHERNTKGESQDD